jgi:hypothetical protein
VDPVDPFLDTPVYGAEAIGEVANVRNADGSVNISKTYAYLERGLIDADKFGARKWVSTPRRILNTFAGKAAAAS